MLDDQREEVINPYTAYQITSMLEGVVQRGTGQALSWSASRWPARPAPPMTSATPGSSAITPDLAVGVYVGYDNPRPMGGARHRRRARGADRRRFHGMALRDKPATPFRVPTGIQLIPIDPTTGQRAAYRRAATSSCEAFKPGEEPPPAEIIGDRMATSSAGRRRPRQRAGEPPSSKVG